MNGQLEGGINAGSGIQEVDTPTELARYSVEDIDGESVQAQFGELSLTVRLTSGTSVTSLNEFSDSTITIDLEYQYLDSSNNIISSESQMYTRMTSELSNSFLSLGAGVFTLFASTLDGLTIPNNAAVAVLLVSFSVSAGANWGLSRFGAPDLRYAALISKSAFTSAYITSPRLNLFALEVQGGRGARINPIELFVGSETAVSGIGAEPNLDEFFIVQVSWDDVNDTGTVSGNRMAIVPLATVGRFAFLDVDNRALGYSTSPPIYNENGDYIGVVSVDSSSVLISLNTGNAASNISNQRIRRIWSKFK